MTNSANKAWVEFKTSLNHNTLIKLCNDLELLYRINPYLEFHKWESCGSSSYFFDLVNHSQEPEFRLQTKLNVSTINDRLKVDYLTGIKCSTIFQTTSTSSGSKMIITEHYHAPESGKYNISEVDKSLNKWAEELQLFFNDWSRWSRFKIWRYYKKHIWLSMKPAGRRITHTLVWISIFEVGLIILGAMIYFLEYH